MIYISTTIGGKENTWHANDGNGWIEVSFEENIPNARYLDLFRKQWGQKYLPNFERGGLYSSKISFFMFRMPMQLFEKATDADQIDLWMGEFLNRQHPYRYSSNPNQPFMSIPSFSPFLVMKEVLLVRLFEKQKLHLFEILYGEQTGWIYAPNRYVLEIERCHKT